MRCAGLCAPEQMIKVIGAAALAIAAPAVAQSAGYKLVVVWNGQAAAITDYPSKARCEVGMAAVRAEVALRNRDAGIPKPLPGGGTSTLLPIGAVAFCIPG